MASSITPVLPAPVGADTTYAGVDNRRQLEVAVVSTQQQQSAQLSSAQVTRWICGAPSLCLCVQSAHHVDVAAKRWCKALALHWVEESEAEGALEGTWKVSDSLEGVYICSSSSSSTTTTTTGAMIAKQCVGVHVLRCCSAGRQWRWARAVRATGRLLLLVMVMLLVVLILVLLHGAPGLGAHAQHGGAALQDDRSCTMLVLVHGQVMHVGV